MKKLFRITLSLLILGTFIGLQGCQKDELGTDLSVSDGLSPELKSKTMNTFYSSTLPVGNGVARAWITENKNGEPISVGIKLSEKALQNLPVNTTQYVFTLPKNKGQNFFTHVLFDWNPLGHEPAEIYDVPHFDIHFYTISNEDRLKIPFLTPENLDTPPASQFDILPASQYIPTFYIPLPGLVPEMGAHWVNFTSPELNGYPFTHTMIWGSYNGEFIFWEPMITLDYLLSKPDATFPISQPEKYQKDGWYANEYKISYSTSPKEYNISLIDLTHQDGE